MADPMPSRSVVANLDRERLGIGHLISDPHFYEPTPHRMPQALPRGMRRALQRKLSVKLAHPSLRRRLRRRLARSLAGAALLLAFSHATEAATINVTTNKAEIKTDGKCSIIEAIINANNHASTNLDCAAGTGADTITLPANTKIIFPPSKSTDPTPLLFTSTVIIQGNGSILSRKKSKGEITWPQVWIGGDVTLSNIKIQGFATLLVSAGGKLTLTETTVSGGSGNFGGAIQSSGLLTIAESTISGNTSSNGGGLHNYRGTATIINSTISANQSDADGGAIVNDDGHLTITNSTISGNIVKSPRYSTNGGAIFNIGGYLGIFDSSITGNTVIGGGPGLNKSSSQVGWAFGGAIDATGTIVIRNSTIADNKAIGAPGRPAIGGAIWCACNLTIENSTISGNAAFGGAKGGVAVAGAVWTSGVVAIKNSTISGNSAVGSTGANSYAGAFMNYHYLTFDSSTITGNTAATQGGGIWSVETGGDGGVSYTQLDLNRTIVSGNQAANGPEIYNYQRNYTTVVVDNRNLFGVNNVPGTVGFTPDGSDIIPPGGVMIGDILAPLADNGGRT
ncbi:MAG TPA: hypothetical protein VGH16_22065, partial [Candidatus Binatia bacterium]